MKALFIMGIITAMLSGFSPQVSTNDIISFYLNSCGTITDLSPWFNLSKLYRKYQI